MGDENTFVYEDAETRNWMCAALGEEGGWRREDGEKMYVRGGKFLRSKIGAINLEKKGIIEMM